jgi:type IV pilus assembly protein PilQ
MLFGATIAIASLHAEPKSKRPQPVDPPKEAISPTTPRLLEFQGEDLSLVLRTLARSAKVNMVVSDDVTGTVSIRLEDKTPREAIEIIVTAKDLLLDDKKGTLYVRARNPPPPAPAKSPKSELPLEEALAAMFTPAVTKFYDSLLDYQARPETAQRIAKAKKALYDALIAEGFTKDEAFRLILTNQEFSIPEIGK